MASVWFRQGAEKRENMCKSGTRWLEDVGGREADFSTALLTKSLSSSGRNDILAGGREKQWEDQSVCILVGVEGETGAVVECLCEWRLWASTCFRLILLTRRE